MTCVDRHWMWLFGLDAHDYLRPGVRVISHGSPFFADYHGAWIFNREQTWIVTVPPALAETVRGKIAEVAPDRLPTAEGIGRLFGDSVERVIGTTFQGGAVPRGFLPFSAHPVRRLGPSDRSDVERLLAACDPEQANHSGVTANDTGMYGCFAGDELAAVAKGTPLSPFAASPGVITEPRFRSRGCGRAVVSAVVETAFAAGHVIVYQTLVANKPSVALALALGVEDYARHTAVRLAPWSGAG
jgi:GNAT superfamily N-acetyltransferase